MIARIRALFASRGETTPAPDGWDTVEGLHELAEMLREATGEQHMIATPVAPYTPRHTADGEASTADYAPRRDGSQGLEDTGYLILHPTYYRERGRWSLHRWRSWLDAQPWSFLRDGDAR